MSAIYILWLRELKRYIRSRAQILSSLAQPVLYLLALGFGFGAVFREAGRGSYLQFIAPGVIAMTVLFSSMFSGIALLWDRQFGFLKEVLVAPQSRITIFMGRTLGTATVAMIHGTLVVIVTLLAGFRPTHVSTIPLAFVFMALIAIVFGALGTAIGSVLQDIQGFQLVMSFLVMPIFFLSGAIFPLTDLPQVLTVLTRADGLSYGVDGLRGAFIGNPLFGFTLDLTVLSVSAVVLLAIGGRLFSRIQL
jgi:ABC-2 type transport system permease protein